MIKTLAPLFFLCILPMFLLAQIFTEESKQRGIDHAYRHKALTGGGAAFFDYDNDGDDDLYLTGGLDRDRLYENLGDGTFNQLPNNIGLGGTIRYNTMGVTTGDIDNDGFRDIFICTWDFQNELFGPNLLFKNDGDGTFTDISESAGIVEKGYAISATFLDYDKDGFLDIYVTNNVETPRFLRDSSGAVVGYDHLCFPNLFYKNNGDLTFTEMGSALGVDSRGCGLAIIASDMDNDADLDIYIANDFGEFVVANEFLANQYPNNAFQEKGATNGTNIGMYGMGIAAGDYDQDLDLDYYVTNIGSNVFLENEAGIFTNKAKDSGIENDIAENEGLSATSWGTAFLDVNNDSWLDLYVANGRIPHLPQSPTATNDPNKLYLNNGDKTFSDISLESGVADERIARGFAYSDIDLDGDLDLFSVILANFEPDAFSKLYINQSDQSNNFIQFKLTGVESNRDAYGAKLWLYAGDQIFLKETYGGGASYASQSSSIVHFGLGELMTVDSLVIDWPNGHHQVESNLSVNQRHTIVENVAMTTSIAELEMEKEMFVVTPNPFFQEINIQFFQPTKAALVIRLIGTNGQIVFEENIPANIRQIPIQGSSLLPGIYTLQLITGEKSVSRKIVKIK